MHAYMIRYNLCFFVCGKQLRRGIRIIVHICFQGRQYDYEGKLMEWWKPETRTKFLEGAQCIIEQYGNITIERANMSVSETCPR